MDETGTSSSLSRLRSLSIEVGKVLTTYYLYRVWLVSLRNTSFGRPEISVPCSVAATRIILDVLF